MTTKPYQIIDTIVCENQLGENPLWHPTRNVFCWIDVEAARYFEYALETKKTAVFDLPFRIGSFGFTRDDNVIIAAFEQGFAKYHLTTNAIDWIAKVEDNLPHTRLNDGRVDWQGRFWAGSMVESDKLEQGQKNYAKGALYRLDLDRSCHKVISDINISNGLCWDLPSKTMLHADSPKQTVTQYPFDSKTGAIGHGTVFFTTEGSGYPDGGTFDKNGHYWHARWSVGNVVCLDEHANVIAQVTVPASQVTSVAIGGSNMDMLFVTSARIGLDSKALALEPEAGNVFIYQLESAIGVAESICLI